MSLTKDFFNDSLNIEKYDVVLYRNNSGFLRWAQVQRVDDNSTILWVVNHSTHFPGEVEDASLMIHRHQIKGLIKNDATKSVTVATV